MGEPERSTVRQAADALCAGRFGECERLASRAAADDPGDAAPGLLAVASFREQGRAAEAEILVRDLLVAHPDHDEGLAMLAAVLVDLGRDGDAGRQLDLVDLERAPLAVCALAAEAAAVLRASPEARTLRARMAAHASRSLGFHGSLARHVGLVAHVLGDWHDAAGHFETALSANRMAGAPVLVAHTCRHYSAVLRLRGEDGDWDRAVALLAEAADIYARLEIETRAEGAEAILRRSLDLSDGEGWSTLAGADTLRPTPTGWHLAYAGRSAVVAGCAGLAIVARLLEGPGRPVHVVDLIDRPTEACLRDQLATECGSRLDDLTDRIPADAVSVSLAAAERDRLEAELRRLADDHPAPREVAERGRRLVTLRVRVALELLDEALPDLGHHLRRSVRTGTFCVYEPAVPGEWRAWP